MQLKGLVTKEDFKRYLTTCNKVAWIYHSLENFNSFLKLKKNKVYECYLNDEINNEDDFENSSGFDPLSLYEHLLKGDNLSDEEIEQRDLILKEMESINGLELLPMDAETIIDGSQIGQAAREYFIEKLYKENIAENTSYSYFDFQSLGYKDTIQKTRDLLNDSNCKMLFEPSFEACDGNLRVRCDILINKGNNRVEIIEVKASSKCKTEHIFDLFYQYYVLTQAGYFVDKVSLCLINKDYYRGVGLVDKEEIDKSVEEEIISYDDNIKPILDNIVMDEKYEEVSDIDYDLLFNIVDRFYDKKYKSSFIEFFLNFIDETDVEDLFSEISNSFENEKILANIKCGKYSIDYKNANFKEKEVYCHHVIRWIDKNKTTLFDISRFKQKAAEIFFTKNVVYMEDIEDPWDKKWVDSKGKKYFNNVICRIIKMTNKYAKTKTINSFDIIDLTRYETLLDLLSHYYEYPIYMYDFETSKWAMPNFNESKTYQQIPFQYSIHVILDDKFDFKKPNKTMKHFNHIEDFQRDPRPKFVKKFIKDSFSYGPGKYVAYNRHFERMVLKSLIFQYPKYSKPLKYIRQNTIDLWDFFNLSQDNWLIYHPDFKGSSSIKRTQPVLNDKLSYKDLRINKGDKASQVFRQFIDGSFSQEKWDKLFKPDMLAYCDRDTLAMVVVLQKIIEYVKDYDKDYLLEIEKILEKRRLSE